MASQVWQLREKLGQQATVDTSDAYVDQLRLVFVTANSGPQKVIIDDWNFAGLVDASTVARGAADQNSKQPYPVIQASAELTTGPVSTEECPYRLNSSVIEVKGRPIAIRGIEHNGEPIRFLQGLGFNTIELRNPPSPELLREANASGVWLLCPPPTEIGLYQLPRDYDCVLAWKLGPGLSHQDLPFVRQKMREIRAGDYWARRPVLLDIKDYWAHYGRLRTVLGFPAVEFGSTMRLSETSRWIEQYRNAAGNPPVLASIPTNLPQEMLRQVATVAGRLPPTPISLEQLEYAVFEAVAGGARGIRFQSGSRLDANDPSSRLRATTIRWLNRQIALLQPWIAAGAVTRRDQLNSSNDRVRLDLCELNTSRARLILIQRTTGNEQWFCGDAETSLAKFQDARALTADQAYWLAPETAVLKSTDSLHAGLEINISDSGPCAAFVVTQSPQVISQLKQVYAASPELNDPNYRIEITQNWLTILQLLDQQNSSLGAASVAVRGQLDQANTYLRQALTSAQRQSETTDRFLLLANRQLAFARREMVLGARRGFTNSLASPLTSHCTLSSDHNRLSVRAGQLDWSPNGLAGGDFENLQHMMEHGWENQRLDSDQFLTAVELNPDSAIGGSLGLQMRVQPREERARETPVLQSNPLWITTGKIPVRAGQIVRLHGWLRIRGTLDGSPHGFMVSDTIGKSALAGRWFTTQGEWQEFSYYRVIPGDDESLRFQFSLIGYGVVDLDEVTIQIADLPPIYSSAERADGGDVLEPIR